MHIDIAALALSRRDINLIPRRTTVHHEHVKVGLMIAEYSSCVTNAAAASPSDGSNIVVTVPALSAILLHRNDSNRWIHSLRR